MDAKHRDTLTQSLQLSARTKLHQSLYALEEKNDLEAARTAISEAEIFLDELSQVRARVGVYSKSRE